MLPARICFEILDPLAQELGEVSSIYKREGKLCARATDPSCGGMALERFLPDDHFSKSGAEALILGAGGSSLALVWYFLNGVIGLIIVHQRFI